MAPDGALTSINPLRQATGAPFGVHPFKQTPAAGPAAQRNPSAASGPGSLTALTKLCLTEIQPASVPESPGNLTTLATPGPER